MAFGAYRLSVDKLGPMGRSHSRICTAESDAQQSASMIGAMYGQDNADGRLEAIKYMAQVRRERGILPTVDVAAFAWGAANRNFLI